MKDPIYILFEKYINGTISTNEWKELKAVTETLSQQAISDILERIWDNYTREGKLPAKSFEQITNSIKPGNSKITPRFSLKRFAAIAAAIVIPLLCLSQLYLVIQNNRINKILLNTHEIFVEEGERATIKLPDGTTVKLNSASSLSYNSEFGLRNRDVRLQGEAYFTVRKDSLCPFNVQTSDVNIRVLGTIFNVSAYTDQDYIETSLIEGSVALTMHNDPSSQIIMKPNEKVIFHKEGNITETITSDLVAETSWITGKLLFNSVEMREVLQQIGRYYGYQFEIIGEGFERDRFSGSFEETDIKSVLEILRLHYDFNYTITDKHIILTFK
ncbi:MAG: FecR family protein [Bacteroidales bacterium]